MTDQFVNTVQQVDSNSKQANQSENKVSVIDYKSSGEIKA